MASLANIGEWKPTSFDHLQPIELGLATFLYASLTRGLRLPVMRIVLMIALLHLALAHARYQMLAGAIGMLILAEPLSAALKDPQAGLASSASLPLRVGWLAGSMCLALLLTGARIFMPIIRADDRASPIIAFQHVPAGLLAGHGFNSYQFGGYLIFNHVQPFIDGRADMFGDEFLANYLKASTNDRAAFQSLVAQYDLRWALLATDSSEQALVSSLPHWRIIHSDATATVMVRDPG